MLCWAGLGRIHVLILFPWWDIISTVLISCYVGHFSLESKLEWKCWLQVRHLPTPPPPPQPPGWYKVSFTSIIAKFYWLVVKNTNFPKNCAVTVGWLETFGWRYARQAKLLEIDIVRLTWKLSCLSQCSAGWYSNMLPRSFIFWRNVIVDMIDISKDLTQPSLANNLHLYWKSKQLLLSQDRPGRAALIVDKNLVKEFHWITLIWCDTRKTFQKIQIDSAVLFWDSFSNHGNLALV